MKAGVYLFMAAALFAEDPQGSLQGTVTDSVTHLPLRKVQVKLHSTPDAGVRQAWTDDNGAFGYIGLKAGMYGLEVARQRYFTVRTSARVQPGSDPSKISVELVPGASIRGRVLDPDGDPVAYCRIWGTAERGTGTAMSGRDGRYEMGPIVAGNYTVAAFCERPPFQPRPLLAETLPSPPPASAYLPVYYPGVAEYQAAQRIEIAAGTAKTGIDLQIAMVPAYSISGVVRFPPGQPATDARLTFMSGIGYWSGHAGTDGRFQMDGIPAGSYTVTANAGTSSSGTMTVNVQERTPPVVVKLSSPVELKASVRLERETSKVRLEQIQVSLFGEGGYDGFGRVDADGNLKVPGLRPMKYRPMVIPHAAYIKSVTIAGQEMQDQQIDLAMAAGEIRILLGTNTGTVRGSAPPDSSIRMVDLSNDSYYKFDRYEGADEQGRFVFRDVAPGKYRIGLSCGAGREVTVGEGETVEVELKGDRCAGQR